MPEREDFWGIAGTARERIPGRRRAIVLESQNLASPACGVLGEVAVGSSRRHVEHAVAAESNPRRGSTVARPRVGGEDVLHVNKRVSFEAASSQRRGYFQRLGLHVLRIGE